MSFFDDTAFPWLHDREGGLSLDPHDSGNWTSGKVGVGELRGTKYGVSAAAHPDLDIKNLTVDDARVIAKNEYWDPWHGDSLPPGVALCVFDFAYNAGVEEAIKVLQRSVHAGVDGICGPETIAMVQCRDPAQTIADFTVERIHAYTLMAAFSTYGKQWIARANLTATKAARL